MQSVQTVVAAIIREIATISRLTVSAVTEIITASRLAVSSVVAIIVRRLAVSSVVAIVLKGSVEMANEEVSAVVTDNFSISISFQKRTVCCDRRFLLFVFFNSGACGRNHGVEHHVLGQGHDGYILDEALCDGVLYRCPTDVR